MEKAANTGNAAGQGWQGNRVLCAAAGLAWAACLSAGAGAQELAPLEAAAEAARAEAPLRMELKASSLPRLELEDGGFQAPRMDVSLLPTGRSAVGVVAGMSQPTARALTNPSGSPGRTTFDVGVRMRHTLADSRQIDVTAWRRMVPPPDVATLVQEREPVYGARVEMNLNAPRRSGLFASAGFIGMQLQSGARISIKRKDGKPMVYYRTSF